MILLEPRAGFTKWHSLDAATLFGIELAGSTGLEQGLAKLFLISSVLTCNAGKIRNFWWICDKSASHTNKKCC